MSKGRQGNLVDNYGFRPIRRNNAAPAGTAHGTDPPQQQTRQENARPEERHRSTEEEEEDEPYRISSYPAGLCVIINNENFTDGDVRSGTDKDAESLAVVFSWLGFRVLMCKDQTKDQMDRALKCFASPSDPSELQEFRVQEWQGGGFVDLQEPPKHGDAFICCILSHGERGVVQGVDRTGLAIKQITKTFRATVGSPLIGKPKVFLIQACQGGEMQHGVFLQDLRSDDPSQFLPEDSDFLLAMATVEDHVAIRHKVDGGWFIQSVCQQLKRRCPSGQDVLNILSHVNNEVSQKEGSRQPGRVKQMPEVRFTLRKRLVLKPHRS